MHKLIPANGRSVEDFTGQSVSGDFGEALGAATTKARLTLGAESIDWRLVHLSGTTTAARTTLTATIKAKSSAD
ncbi:MAG: hypothetical protein IPL39_14045 [Opitutaceae bacterium]|nr:hypothetical protein [Opitutaceae bacterium]